MLAVPGAIVYAAFNGQTEPLIPLFAVAVFVAFTLVQAGMVAHWWSHREHAWQRALAINLLGDGGVGYAEDRLPPRVMRADRRDDHHDRGRDPGGDDLPMVDTKGVSGAVVPADISIGLIFGATPPVRLPPTMIATMLALTNLLATLLLLAGGHYAVTRQCCTSAA